jgi:hypothetical protein
MGNDLRRRRIEVAELQEGKLPHRSGCRRHALF